MRRGSWDLESLTYRLKTRCFSLKDRPLDSVVNILCSITMLFCQHEQLRSPVLQIGFYTCGGPTFRYIVWVNNKLAVQVVPHASIRH